MFFASEMVFVGGKHSIEIARTILFTLFHSCNLVSRTKFELN